MKFDRLAVLLPCYSFESFDLDRKEADAEQLLSAWSALWHPALLAGSRSIPRWLPAGSPPPDPAGHLVILPECCDSMLPEEWLAQAEAAGACVLRGLPNRDDMLAAALERLGDDGPAIDADLAADFLALGFCHLLVELLTRKLRYMSNLDEGSLQTAVLAATDAAVAGDLEAARQHLQTAFDRLHDAREYFYPTESKLIDLTLLAPSTLGMPLQTELADTTPRNFLVSGEVIEKMAQHEPAVLEALRTALTDNRAALIGGEQVEIPLPLLDPESLRRHFSRGQGVYEKHLGQRPKIFGRRRFGLSSVLPQKLKQAGFTAAIHCTLDDGRFPVGNQSRIQWEGIDGTVIEATGCLPLDASRAETFLRLAETLSNAMNLDHSATIMFAHWPGRACRWYDDLRRTARYGSVFGKFQTATDYFELTSLAGQRNNYKPDQYRSPYLAQDVTAGRHDPISRWMRYFQRCLQLEAVETVAMLAVVCRGRVESQERRGERDEECVKLATNIEDALISEDDAVSDLDDQLAKAEQQPLADFARSLGADAKSAERGCLIVNPWSFSQPAVSLSSPISALHSLPDVPGMGFAWADANAEPPPDKVERKGWFGLRKPQEQPSMAEENVLRNEFFEVHFDPHTGAMRTISDYHSRGPRLGQQIALRLPQGGDPGADANYSIMAADELSVVSSGPAVGEMLCRGRLLDHEGRRVANFRQTTRAQRGSRILEIQIDLEIERQPGPNAWDSYYAVRFAWKDEMAVLRRGVNMANQATELMQFESPWYVDICRSKQHTTLLCNGLPYHRRFGLRKLDTLLVTQGERARSFRLGVGIDVPNPMAAAQGFMVPPLILPDTPKIPTPSGWLFHLDCRNVLATHWELCDGGFRVRLLETDGRGVRLGLRCLRSVASARRTNADDSPTTDLKIDGDRVEITVDPHQWIEIEVQFAS